MRIEYKRAALFDLQQTQDYIANILKNKFTAQKLVTSVLHAVSLLSDHPMMGTALIADMMRTLIFGSSLCISSSSFTKLSMTA